MKASSTLVTSSSAARTCGKAARMRPLRAKASEGGSSSPRRPFLVGTGTVAAGLLASTAGSPGRVTAASVAEGSGAIARADVCPGLNISRVVKGCWQLSGGHRGDKGSDRTQGKSAVEDFDAFVSAGVTTFDTADIYGPSEELIGKYLDQRPEGAEGLQVFTKFCCFGSDMGAIAEKMVDKRIKASRMRLRQQELDLVQLYWHDYNKKNYVDAMRCLYANENVKNVGVTNFDVPRIAEMVDAGVPPVLNQVQYSILDRRPENAMTDFCAKNNIKLLPYGVVAGGFLSDKYLGLAASEVKFDTYSKQKYASVISQLGGWNWFQELLRTLHDIAESKNTTIANVASKWVLDKPQVAGILIGARNASHVSDMAHVNEITLGASDLEAINAVLDKGKQAKGDCYDWERGGTF